MVTYDYSKEPNNPWDAATWDPRAQIDFMRRMRYSFGGTTGNAEARIMQRIAQSDTKGLPPTTLARKRPPYQVIVQNRYLQPPITDITLGFGLAGAIEATTQWTLPVVTSRVQWPSSTPSDARCDVAPTSDTSLTLSTAFQALLICTITFPAGSVIGNFAWSAPTSYITQPGDLLYLLAAPSQDPTFSGVNLAFIGRKLSS